jgi:hypothetical protein
MWTGAEPLIPIAGRDLSGDETAPSEGRSTTLAPALGVPANLPDGRGELEPEDGHGELRAAVTSVVPENGGPEVARTTPDSADREQQTRVLESAARAARRRSTFARLLHAAPALGLSESATARSLDRRGAIAVTDLAPAAAVSTLFRAVLGREADSDDLALWCARLEQGQPLLDLARELATSAEALRRSPEHRARIELELRSWESLVAVNELGVAAWHPVGTYAAGTVAHEVFVGALFEVALQRQPSRDEARFEVAKLVDGVGREWLLRAYAARPEVTSRLLGEPARGVRGRLRRIRDGRHHLETFRALVVAAEARQVARILANVAPPGSSLPDVVDGSALTSGER